MFQNRQRKFARKNVENVMIVGAGEATEILLREFQNSRFLTQNIVCLVDDNPYKNG